ncbi:sensor histidine kinase [Shewanella sedimentimangrovi]|uniref:histidine kinase n=1 Tax=Shewanella sedimentimangrovi TaxID=2814293 RepID=A0ABX7R3Q1_9GAMM|nr:HAMP domain-containing sensor histidine kinase [Shewanella sedimentimangrovi]QSX37725.1 HAMP domain-containing histidine kinase [Shewanella sedimentimangrovi]
MNKLSYYLMFKFLKLRTQAMGLLAMVLVAILLTSSYALSKKDELYHFYGQILQLNSQSEDLTKSHLILIEVMTDLLMLKQPLDQDGNFDRNLLSGLHQNFLALAEAKNVIAGIMPEHTQDIEQLLKMMAAMVMQPSSELVNSVLAQSRQTNHNLVTALQEQQQLRSQLSEKYLQTSEESAQVVMMVVLLIALFTSVLCISFFSMLTSKINLAVKQIQLLVRNQKPEQLPVSRSDEIGQLFSAVNQVSIELEKKDQQLAFGRYTYFNQVRSASLKHLVAGLIHELGNPIAGIKGLLGAYEMSDPEQRTEALELITQQVEKLEAFNTHLVNFASEYGSDSEILDLTEQVKQYIYFLNLDERWYQVDIQMDIVNDIPAVRASREQMSLLLNNICDNALLALQKSFKKNQTLHFTLQNADNKVQLEIADNGIGMSPQLIDVCLEPYITTQEDIAGAGFGLSICRSVMEDIKGSITISSEQGKGCKVTLTFPREDLGNE